jgi:hypothetical protein
MWEYVRIYCGILGVHVVYVIYCLKAMLYIAPQCDMSPKGDVIYCRIRHPVRGKADALATARGLPKDLMRQCCGGIIENHSCHVILER